MNINLELIQDLRCSMKAKMLPTVRESCCVKSECCRGRNNQSDFQNPKL